ncbi:MAG: nucleotidyltransferase family protein [Ruminococcaceae bacterium]|nr:nucleotidyltransferase family protein [Oscillospiraceae bacterium]
MKVAGIIAEYNPFHLGHSYHLSETVKSGITHTIAVMSGNYVQRADTAILNKFDRAAIAVRCGVDLVLELPTIWSTASAERFAMSSVSILEALNCVDYLSFGSESGDIELLKKTADSTDDSRVVKRTKQLTEMGDSYPLARMKALEVFYPELAKVITSPNNILGIEYIKALRATSKRIVPMTVKRTGASYHSDEITDGFASASKIRELIMNRGAFGRLVPRESEISILDATISNKISGGLKAIESAILMTLRDKDRDYFSLIPDSTGGLGDRIFNAVENATSLEDLYGKAKTKRYTMSRVKRGILTSFLGITEKDYTSVPYIRILAIGSKGEELLSKIKKSANLPISHSLLDIKNLRGVSEQLALKESRFTDIFNLTLTKVAPKGEEYTNKLFTFSSKL